MEQRVNRVTSAHWRFESGAVGALNHSCMQHCQNFYTTFEVRLLDCCCLNLLRNRIS